MWRGTQEGKGTSANEEDTQRLRQTEGKGPQVEGEQQRLNMGLCRCFKKSRGKTACKSITPEFGNLLAK